MHVFTEEHLLTARKMPRKKCQLWLGTKENRRYEQTARRQRKTIADAYRFFRNNPDYGPAAARRAHRYGMSITATDAKYRLGQLA